MHSFLKTLGQTLFPDRCTGCAARGTLLCGACRKSLLPAETPNHAFITSVFSYRDPRVRKLVRNLKYKNGRRVVSVFAPELALAVTEHMGEEQNFLSRAVLFVPVPLSKKRLHERGYNQAEALARGIIPLVGRDNIRVETRILKKTIETRPQADIKRRSERLANLDGCFSASVENCTGRETVFLFDDVTTTGATLVACRNALRKAGFRNIHAFTLAH
jgi:ComF family protein